MPRAINANPEHQLAKVLAIGDGKVGKTRWAGMAAAAGFNVLYLDADVGSQTIASLPKEALERIFIMNCADKVESGGISYNFVETYKKFVTARPTFKWNDTQSREYSLIEDGDSTTDDVWEIRPPMMDHTCVLVVDSWTSLVQSTMRWAAEDAGVDLSELDSKSRNSMRSVYQAAGEKLTSFLEIIRAAKCHVIVIAHTNEFVKTKKPDGKTIAGAKEGELQVLWTKLVPKSSSNNHSLTMPKYFTDLGWFEVDALGRFMVDYRPHSERLSGSHFNERLEAEKGGSFAELVKKIGGVIPKNPSFDHWLTLHEGGFVVETPAKKESLVLGSGKTAPAKVAGLSLGGKK